MPEYKLTYFNLRGRAELSRLIFAYAGQKFQDVRIEREQWPELKETMPFKQLPVLEVDGELLTQSHTIARYLARTFKIAGRNDLEAAQADAYIDIIYDMLADARNAMVDSQQEGLDSEQKKEVIQKFLSETLTPKLMAVEKQLKANGFHYLVGEKLTWADIGFYAFLSGAAEMFGPPVFNRCIHLKVLVERVGNDPNIRKYVQSRPKTPY